MFNPKRKKEKRETLTGDSMSISISFFESLSLYTNAPLIDQIFKATKADTIKKIPFSKRLSPNVLIWLVTRNGAYSVQSAYQLISEDKKKKRKRE